MCVVLSYLTELTVYYRLVSGWPRWNELAEINRSWSWEGGQIQRLLERTSSCQLQWPKQDRCAEPLPQRQRLRFESSCSENNSYRSSPLIFLQRCRQSLRHYENSFRKQNDSAKKSDASEKKQNASANKSNASTKKNDIATNGELERWYYLSFSILAIPTSIWVWLISRQYIIYTRRYYKYRKQTSPWSNLTIARIWYQAYIYIGIFDRVEFCTWTVFYLSVYQY